MKRKPHDYFVPDLPLNEYCLASVKSTFSVIIHELFGILRNIESDISTKDSRKNLKRGGTRTTS